MKLMSEDEKTDVDDGSENEYTTGNIAPNSDVKSSSKAEEAKKFIPKLIEIPVNLPAASEIIH